MTLTLLHLTRVIRKFNSPLLVYRYLILLLVAFLTSSAYGQDRLQKIYEEINRGNSDKAKAKLSIFKNEDSSFLQDSVRSDFFYLCGLLEEQNGNVTEGMQHYRNSIKLAENSNHISSSYVPFETR